MISVILFATACMMATDAKGCTSAIISASKNPSGRPLLWKHRDTSTVDNKVEYVPAVGGDHAYVALFNAKDRNLEEAWIGMNDAGLAVMNTASFNLKDDKVSKKKMDREGFLMTRALKTCRTVDDFARLLDTLPRPMGVEANFGVIDATGAGAFFETNNHRYHRFDLKDAPDGVLIRTNYSHSGRKGEGHGYNREKNAVHLLEPYVANDSVTPEVLTEVLSRSFYHDEKGRDFSYCGGMVADDEFIPRYKSTATIVIEGCRPVEDPDSLEDVGFAGEYVMWTGLGYPPCAEIVPVWCRPDGVDQELRGTGPDGRSPMCDRVKALRDDIFSVGGGGKKKEFDMTRLYNSEGTGIVQTLRKKNRETYGKNRQF